MKEFIAEDNEGLEFYIGNFMVEVDILAVDGDDIDYRVTELWQGDMYQELDLDTDELYESIKDYCIEEGYMEGE